MADPDEFSAAVAAAPNRNARVALIRRIPEEFGTAQHQAVYARVAERSYAHHLKPDFAYVHWRPDYELEPLTAAFEDAVATTNGFSRVDHTDLVRAIATAPRTLRVFRLILGLTGAEFAEATEKDEQPR